MESKASLNERASSRIIVALVAVLGLGLLAGCGDKKTAERVATPMAGVTSLNGAGATFPAPLFKRWFGEYEKTHPDVSVTYDVVGSGASNASLKARWTSGPATQPCPMTTSRRWTPTAAPLWSR